MFLIAHRANNNHKFSENSLPAISDVLGKDYIGGIEIDVRITKDKQLVLIHDPVIDFISDGTGIVSSMNLDELRKYKYGKSKEEINILNEILNKITTNKIILIELKEMSNDYINLVDETIKVINKYSNLNIFISSFNFLLLTYLKNNYPSVKCGLIIGYGLNTLKINNNFDFNIVSSKYINKFKKKDYNFVFGIKEENLNKLKADTYLITDDAYLFAKNKK
jgi:glycerophosphoryl diester phosphodiesterase